MSLIYKDGQYYGKGGSEMPAEDMSEVASPMPSVMSRLPILFDESGAERIVGWYKLANGTKKPVYERELRDTSPFSGTSKSIDISVFNVDKLIFTSVAMVERYQNIEYYTPSGFYNGSDRFYLDEYYSNAIILGFTNNIALNRGSSGYIAIIRYTKTTDTPV